MTVASDGIWIKKLSSMQHQSIMKNTSKYLGKKKREKASFSSKAKMDLGAWTKDVAGKKKK